MNSDDIYEENEFRWSIPKSDRLKRARGASFDEVLQGKIIGLKHHPTREDQRILLVAYKNYVWVIPCVVEKEYIFLKTVFQSRKYTKLYKKGEL
jgi:hypothetical protein